MYKLYITFFLISSVSIVLSEKDNPLSNEEDKLVINAPEENNETTTFPNNYLLDIDTTTSVNIDIITATEHQKTENSNEPQLRSAIADDHTTENYTTINNYLKSIDSESLTETNYTKRDSNMTDLKQENISDQIEDYDETKMQNISNFSLNSDIEYKNLDQRMDGHQNVYLNIKSRSSNEDDEDDEDDEDKNKGLQIDTTSELFEDSRILKNGFMDESKVRVNRSEEFSLSNDTAKLKNEEYTETQLRNAPNEHDSIEYTSKEDMSVENLNNKFQNNQQSTDVYNNYKPMSVIQEAQEKEKISATNEMNERPNTLLDLKYRSGKPDNNIDDQDAVENITPPVMALPAVQMISSSEIPDEETKTIDDYNNQLTSNAYAYQPTNVSKIVKKPDLDRSKKKSPVEEEAVKDIIENNGTRRVYENIQRNHPVFIPKHMDLGTANMLKKDFNLELKAIPKNPAVDSEFKGYSHENLPTHLVAKLNPNHEYKYSQLRVLAAHLSPASVNELVSKINHLLAKPSISNILKEQLNSLHQMENKYKQVPWPLLRNQYSLFEPDNLRNLEKHKSAELSIDEYQIKPAHIGGVNIHTPVSGVTPRLRDGLRSGVPSKFNWLMLLHRQRKRSRRRQQHRHCRQSLR